MKKDNRSGSQKLLELVFGVPSTKEQRIWDSVKNQMTPLEYDILIKRIVEGKTLKETGEDVSRSRERCRQIEAKALRKLRHPIRARLLLEQLNPVHYHLREIGDSLKKLNTMVAVISTCLTAKEERTNSIFIIPQGLLKKSVKDFEMSVRLSNALYEGNIFTVGQIIRKTESELLRMRHFGKKSLEELKKIITPLGLHLGTDI